MHLLLVLPPIEHTNTSSSDGLYSDIEPKIGGYPGKSSNADILSSINPLTINSVSYPTDSRAKSNMVRPMPPAPTTTKYFILIYLLIRVH